MANRLLGRRLATGTAVLALVAGVAGIAGCGRSDDALGNPPPQVTESPSPTPTPTVDPLEVEVLAAFDTYFDAVMAAKIEADPSGETLAPLMEEVHVRVIADWIQFDLERNRRFEGRVEVVWAELFEDNLDDSVPHVVVRTCMDASNFRQIDLDTGELVGADPAEHQPRHEVRVFFRPAEDGGWEARSAQWPRWFGGEVEEHAPQC